jgi:hypothetical protein
MLTLNIPQEFGFEVVAESSMRMNVCAEKPTHRKSANRWWQYLTTTQKESETNIIHTSLNY